MTAPSRTASLSVTGRQVADYVWRPSLPGTVSPRPFLHPVRTLTGTEVTESMPDDHRHHLGVSVAVADVAGANFWGGRTFVSGRGSMHLPNHGTQRHEGWADRTASTLTQDLSWAGPGGDELLRERRHIAALPIDSGAWALDFSFRLSNVVQAPLALASPAANGRPGAGYGGFFWRARRGSGRIQVLGPGLTGAQALHGRHTPWMAISGNHGAPWTLIFIHSGPDTDPWFVRTGDYAGVGSSLAWDRPLVLAPGAEVGRRIITVVADGRLRSDQVAGLVGAVTADTPGSRPATPAAAATRSGRPARRPAGHTRAMR
ncbi:PmoA family protein [Phytomonospora sp. NPDC050363]|uniref:DUF6807 domain-containing protein n=1 Tax=Phytomonospora sp. NPDC050363 TaxID=3155642 RepID=UPI0033ED1F8F